MNIKMDKIKKVWKENIESIRVHISIEKLKMESVWEFDKQTRFLQNINNIGRYCSHIPQKVLEQNNTCIMVLFFVKFKSGSSIPFKKTISNIEDIEIIFNSLEDDIMVSCGGESLKELKKEESFDESFLDGF